MNAPVAAAVPSSGASSSLLERWAPISGAIFVVLFVASLVVAVSQLDTGEKVGEIGGHFANDEYRTAAVITLLLALLGAAFFLWFLADLSASVRAVSGGMLAFLVPIAGIVFIVSLVAGLATWVTPLYNVGHSELAGADPKAAAASYVLLSSLGFSLFVLGTLGGALMMGAAATTAYRAGLIPRWLAITVVAAAVIAAIGSFIFLIPGLLVLLWVLVASIRRTMLAARGALPVTG